MPLVGFGGLSCTAPICFDRTSNWRKFAALFLSKSHFDACPRTSCSSPRLLQHWCDCNFTKSGKINSTRDLVAKKFMAAFPLISGPELWHYGSLIISFHFNSPFVQVSWNPDARACLLCSPELEKCELIRAEQSGFHWPILTIMLYSIQMNWTDTLWYNELNCMYFDNNELYFNTRDSWLLVAFNHWEKSGKSVRSPTSQQSTKSALGWCRPRQFGQDSCSFMGTKKQLRLMPIWVTHYAWFFRRHLRTECYPES